MASTLYGLCFFRGKNYTIRCIVSNVYLYSIVPPINVPTAGNGGLISGVAGGVIVVIIITTLIAVCASKG